ncbi:MAG: iron-containing alcohol dehydrogenase, partial [Pseudomonadota bacterium]
MKPFSFSAGAMRVEFGRGAFAAIPKLVEALGKSRALVLATPHQKPTADRTADLLGAKSVGVFAGAVMHTPVDVTKAAAVHAASVKADCLVSIGGGSTTGLGKAIAYRTGLTHIVVP